MKFSGTFLLVLYSLTLLNKGLSYDVGVKK